MASVLAKFSETNLANAVALVLADRLLEAGYLVYWHEIDAVQTPDGFYYEYSTAQATYLADPAFKARVDGAAGLLTLKGKVSSNPEYPVRPTSDATLSIAQSDVAIPSLAIEVGPQVNGRSLEVGSRRRSRSRSLTIYGWARSVAEQTVLRDGLAAWFDENELVTVRDQDTDSLDLVGTLDVTRVLTDSAILADQSDATTYEVILHARLEYEA